MQRTPPMPKGNIVDIDAGAKRLARRMEWTGRRKLKLKRMRENPCRTLSKSCGGDRSFFPSSSATGGCCYSAEDASQVGGTQAGRDAYKKIMAGGGFLQRRP